jgi:hypothetical protein
MCKNADMYSTTEQPEPLRDAHTRKDMMMNNNLYHWHDDFMAELEMREVRRQMEHVRMLKEAGIPGDGWLVRAVKALGNLFAVAWKMFRDRRFIEHQAEQSKSEKFAQ